MSTPSSDAAPPTLTPGRAMMALGLGHAAWGAVAYRAGLGDVVRAGLADSVGDGLFRVEHSQGPRAAAFWFMFAAPMLWLMGLLLHRAEVRDDPDALLIGARAIGVLGIVVVPRSGFPAALPLSVWLWLRSRQPEPPEARTAAAGVSDLGEEYA